MQRQRMKDLLLRARVFVRTSNMKISRRHLADYVKKLLQKACRTCNTIIFPHSTNKIIYLWRCCCRCRRHFLNSLIVCNREYHGDKNVTNLHIWQCFARAFFHFGTFCSRSHAINDVKWPVLQLYGGLEHLTTCQVFVFFFFRSPTDTN